jgi:hypothetical protein
MGVNVKTHLDNFGFELLTDKDWLDEWLAG